MVIRSEAFLAKQWTGRKLDALWELDVVLPVWHAIDKTMLVKYSPLLAGKMGISTAEGIDVVARAIVARVFKPHNDSQEGFSHISRDFAAILA